MNSPFPVRDIDITREKANEYMQVSGLLTSDIDVLAEVANDLSLTADELRAQIKLTLEKKDELIADKQIREDRWGAYLAIYSIFGMGPDGG